MSDCIDFHRCENSTVNSLVDLQPLWQRPCLNQIEYARHWGRRWSEISPTPSFMWERLTPDNELKQGSLYKFKLAVAHRNSVIENNLKSLALNAAGSQINLRCAADWHQAQTDRQTDTHSHINTHRTGRGRHQQQKTRGKINKEKPIGMNALFPRSLQIFIN